MKHIDETIDRLLIIKAENSDVNGDNIEDAVSLLLDLRDLIRQIEEGGVESSDRQLIVNAIINDINERGE